MKPVIGICIIAALLACGKSEPECTYEQYRQIHISSFFDIQPKYPIDNLDDAKKGSCFELTYDKQGRLAKIAYYLNGRLSNNRLYDFAIIYIVYEPNTKIYAKFDKNYNSTLGSPDIITICYRYDESGKVKSKENHGEQRKMVEDSLGIAKYYYSRDSDNPEILSIIGTNLQGDTVVDNQGVYRTIAKLNKNNYKEEITNFDKLGNPVEDIFGVWKKRCTFDENMNLVRICCYGKDDSLTDDRKLGAAVIEFKYDNFDRPLNLIAYDKKMQVSNHAKSGYPIQYFDYDDCGNLSKITEIDKDSTVFKIQKFAGWDTPSELGFHDFKGSYIMNQEEGYAVFRITIDSLSGKTAETRFLNENEQLIEPEKHGLAIQRAEYNDAGRLICEYCLGADLQPRFNKARGFSRAIYKYDDKGKLIEAQKYDIDGSLIQGK